MGSIATANALAYLISALVCSILASRFGPRPVISGALLLCGLGLIATSRATSVETAALGQFLTGLGSGGAVSPVYALVGSWFTARRRGTATGIMQTGSGVGLVLGGLLIPVLLILGGTGGNPNGWRLSWLVLGLVVCSIGLAAGLLLRNPPKLAAAGSQAQTKGGGPGNLATLGSVYRSGRVWHLGAIFCCFGLSYVVYTIFFGDYLLGKGFSSQEAGSLWGLAGAVSAVGSIAWGWLADRAGRRFTLVLVQALQGTFLIWLALSDNRPGLYIGAIVYGFTLGGVPILMALAATEAAGPRWAAAAFGLATVCFSTGQLGGPLLAGWLKDASGSLVLPMVVAAGIAFFGAGLSLLLRMVGVNRTEFNN